MLLPSRSRRPQPSPPSCRRDPRLGHEGLVEAQGDPSQVGCEGLAREGSWGGFATLRPAASEALRFCSQARSSDEIHAGVQRRQALELAPLDSALAAHRFDQALAQVDTALRDADRIGADDRATLLQRRGRALFFRGALQGAADSWRACLALSPVHPGCLEGLERLRAEGL